VWYGRESNPRPPAPKADALSIRPQTRSNSNSTLQNVVRATVWSNLIHAIYFYLGSDFFSLCLLLWSDQFFWRVKKEAILHYLLIQISKIKHFRLLHVCVVSWVYHFLNKRWLIIQKRRQVLCSQRPFPNLSKSWVFGQ